MSLVILETDRADRNTCHEPVADSDEALLRAFVSSRDDVAFADLVARHASLVMGVCRRVLGNEQDAEDAFQATFLVLARKANSLRNARSLPAWLHKTAHRIALKSRGNKARRREQPLETGPMIEDPATLQTIATDHERSVLDEELNRLPERLRLPLFLCCLEGKSREEAARQLGWSAGSLKGRLERARQLLRRRLILRGVSLSVAMAMVMRGPTVASAAVPADLAVPPDLIASAVQAGMRYAAGQSPVGYVAIHAHLLANWSLQIMSITSAKFFAVACLIVGVVTLGTQWTVVPAAAEGQGTQVITLQATAAALAELTFVALLDDEREGGAERREGERREDAEGREREQPRREGEGARREGEARREGDRPREGEGRREGFRPQTENEEMLYRMILQLQREVVELRNALRYRLAEPRREAGERERDLPRRDADQPRREGDQPRREGDRPAPTREGERRDSDQE